MAGINPPLTAAERAQRSVFVGNIPYEATEEQLKDIFQQVGPVVSFRLVYDRETGKPKGYGFCEYQDVETAQSAMRNLNNFDFNGRPLRVGVAAGEQNKEEMKSMQQATGNAPIESPFGDPVEPEKAPEAISKAVASLPPEQMFELMKQMKLCIQNNPNEARNMLLQNPQLAYALLQAQIVMKIVDPQVALAMLHRESEQIPPLLPTSTAAPPVSVPERPPAMSHPMDTLPAPGPGMGVQSSMGAPMGGAPMGGAPSIQSMGMNPSMGGFGTPTSHAPPASMSGGMPPHMAGQPPRMSQPSHMPPADYGGQGARPGMGGPPMGMMNDNHMGGPRPGMPGPNNMGAPPMGGHMGDPRGPDMRGPPNMGGRGPEMGRDMLDPRNMGRDRDMRDPRDMGGPHDMGRGMHGDPRDPRQMGGDQRQMGGDQRQMGNDPRHMGSDPRQMGGRVGDPRQMGAGDPRGNRGPPPPGGSGPHMPMMDYGKINDINRGGLPATGPHISAADQEKAALIMQVLQLSDQQIAMLPPDQRTSILILKDQISRSTAGGP